VDEVFNDAIFFSQTQEELLLKARTALRRMQELAALAQEQPRTPPAAFASEYHTLTCFLSNIASKEIRGQRLFGQKHLVLDLDEAGNKLVMGGIDLGGPVFTGVISANIASPINASRALVKIQAAQEELAIHQSVAAANQSRLVFLSKDRELLEEGPRPAPDLTAVVGRRDENAPTGQGDEPAAPPHELLTAPRAKAA
jgi:flagellin-like hook-associated protein FlgL